MINSYVLSSIHILTAILQFTLAGIIYLTNRRSTANRAIAALLVLFGITSASVAAAQNSLTASQFIPWAVIQSISVYSIGTAILMVSILVLRPVILEKWWIRLPLTFILILPGLLIFTDILGISANLFGTHLILSLDYIKDIYTGGYVSTSVYQTGPLYPALITQLFLTSGTSLVYPSLFVFLADRKKNPVNSRFALMLFIASLIASIFSGYLKDFLPETIGALVSSNAFTVGFVYIGLRKTDPRVNITGFANLTQNFPMYYKLLMATGGVVLPAILFIGFSTFSFIQSTLVDITGDSLHTIALTESSLVGNIIDHELEELLNLAARPDIKALIADSASMYTAFSQAEIDQLISDNNSAWERSDENLINHVIDSTTNQELREYKSEEGKEFSYLFVTDQFGSLITSTDFVDTYDYSGHNWWQYIIDNGTAYVGTPAWDDVQDATYILIAVPLRINPSDPTISGVLLGRYNLDAAFGQIQKAASETRAFEMYNERGGWIPSSDPLDTTFPTINWDLLNTNPSQNWLFMNFGGEDNLVAWAAITTSEEYPSNMNWNLLAYSSYEDTLGSLVVARTVLLLLIILILIGSSALTVYFARLITDPLHSLTQAAERILAGERNVRAEIEGQDEVATLASTFNRMTAELNTTVEDLEINILERTQELQKRAFQLETAAQVAREAAEIRDLRQLLDHIVNLISERFDFYHTGIFLLDERGEYAILQAANSDGGQRMLARGHKLQVGKVGVVGFTAGMGQPRIAQDVGADVVYYDNPDMPNTRSEMALPMAVGGKVFGVLDLQSTAPNAFKRDDVQILQVLADQIALAIENTRLLQGSQQALQELEQLYGQQVAQAWKKKTTGQKIAYQYSPIGASLADFSSSAGAGFTNSGQKLTQEIYFRGQVIGEIDLVREFGESGWSEDERVLVEEILEQTALALENARLVDQIRLRSDQIQLLQEITSMAASLLDEPQLMESVAQRLYTGLDLLHCGVVLLDETQDMGTLVASASGLADTFQPPLNMVIALQTDGITSQAVQEKKTLVYPDIQNDHRAQVYIRAFNAPDTYTTVILPLIARGDVVGLINLDVKDPEREIDDEDMNLFEQIRAQLSAAMDSSRLFQAEQRGRQAAAALLEITQIASSSLDLNQVLTEVTQLSAAAVRANRATVFILDDKDGLSPLVTQFADGRKIREDLWAILQENTAKAFGSIPTDRLVNSLREALIIDDPINFEDLPLDWAALLGIKKFLLVPLISQDTLIGTLAFDHVHVSAEFTQEHIELALTIAGQIATTIENANLFDNTVRRAERERLVAEITAKIRTSNDPKVILHTAINELRGALAQSKLKAPLPTGGSETSDDPTPQSSNGHEELQHDTTEG